MSVIKCKICGGDVELTADKTLGSCEYCGCTMTFPKVDDDQRAAAFNRGNHFRRTGEFDKALSVYERIVNEDDNDAEAHWCCALCRFGIEYVEDPTTFEWLPTMHRLSYDSFLEDVDYLSAVKHSDGITRRQYQRDAMKIAEVQRGILATSQNEDPFDVFICYKESDENGNRTVDSSLAQDIYYQLMDKGYKVFFSRITLEDKVGTEYEPYIFAALNSAKVMLVIGTKPEYFNAVWVKNEWSRFIAIMKKDRKRVLLPCYRGMDPYDMPEALSVLQSYDMAKIGFIQDLIRGIEKIVTADEPKVTVKETIVVQQTSNANAAPLLKRAFMFLEDGEWTKADDFCEQVLNLDPECAEAYLGKLMAELECSSKEELVYCKQPFNQSANYKKILKFGNQDLINEIKGYVDYIIYENACKEMKSATVEVQFKEAAKLFDSISGFKDSNKLKKECIEKGKNCLYTEAYDIMKSATVEEQFKKAAEIFRRVSGYKDSDRMAEICVEKAEEAQEKAQKKAQEEAQKEAIYRSAVTHSFMKSIEVLNKAIEEFESVSGYKESDKLAEECKAMIEKIKQENEKKRIEAERLEKERIIAAERAAAYAAERAAKKKKRVTAIVFSLTALAAVCIALAIILNTVIIP